MRDGVAMLLVAPPPLEHSSVGCLATPLRATPGSTHSMRRASETLVPFPKNLLRLFLTSDSYFDFLRLFLKPLRKYTVKEAKNGKS